MQKFKKIIVVVTNTAKYHHPDIDRVTGFWFSEVSHFVDEVLKHKGIEIDYVSPLGGFVPIDPASLQPEAMDQVDWNYYTNHNWMSRVEQSLPVRIITNVSEYQAIYFAGGHGPLWDVADNTEFQRIAQMIHAQGGVVAATCHGTCGLLNITNSVTSDYLLKDIKVTGFSDSEEKAVGLDKAVPYSLEQEIKKRGGKYEKANKDWDDFVVVENRVVTGQNPASTRSVAKEVLKLLDGPIINE